jgi:hypothetical protein
MAPCSTSGSCPARSRARGRTTTSPSPLIRACFRRGGSHLQIYVESREVLIDADAHPDKYPGLLVYVNGYSTLWDELGETLKREIIARSDPSIDENTDLTPPDRRF